jgi:hypothetical protein
VHCPACNYDLHGLPAGPCPECASPFDPAFPPRAAQRRAALARRFGIAALFMAPSFLYTYAAIVASFLAAWAELGHRPRPHVDDPSAGNSAVLAFAAALSVCFAPLLTLGSIACAIAAAILQRRYLRWSLVALLAIAIVPATIAVMRNVDPGGIIAWFAD